MDLKLAKKVVFVSGSSSGIGFSIAKVLYNEGCTVILNGRHKSSLKKSAKSIGDNVDYFPCDITKLSNCKSAIKYIIKKYGKLDVVVAVAARFPPARRLFKIGKKCLILTSLAPLT